MSLLRKAKTKRVLCTHCGKANEVSGKAMSVFCSHCRKRLILENYTIKSYQGVKGYATCGDVVVEKSGRVNAGIQAGNLTIKGHVNGDVLARGTVHVAKTGVLTGRVEAHALDILPGAAINAVCRIGPSEYPVDEPAAEALTSLSPPGVAERQSPGNGSAAGGEAPTDEAAKRRRKRERIPDEPVEEGAEFAPAVIRPREVAARQRAASQAAAAKRSSRSAAKTVPAKKTAKRKSASRKKVKSDDSSPASATNKTGVTKKASAKSKVKKAKTRESAPKKRTTKDTPAGSASDSSAEKSVRKSATDKKKIKKITTRRVKKSR